MIRLSRAKIGIDIIALRPGEKLYEELLYDVNKAVKTKNNKIFITHVEAMTKRSVPIIPNWKRQLIRKML
ncbi:Polysaccharide biosynthesis protein [Fusobacterium necrophorum subsp. necrophorum]|nr:Polysaccharide biosynthesis protein [Fusobacterium necrophorum subsp. necrophorum]